MSPDFGDPPCIPADWLEDMFVHCIRVPVTGAFAEDNTQKKIVTDGHEEEVLIAHVLLRLCRLPN